MENLKTIEGKVKSVLQENKDACRFIRLDGHFLVGGQDIARGCLVADLGHGVLADTQSVNYDFAVLVRLECLVVIFADDTEREALP